MFWDAWSSDPWSRPLQVPEAASNATLYCCETEKLLDQMTENTGNFVGRPERGICETLQP